MDSRSQQSPIHLSTEIYSKNPIPLTYHWKLAEGVPKWTEHGLVIDFPLSDRNYALLGSERYLLRNFHFHHPSEHLLEARQFEAELHIVLQNLQDLTYLVLGVLIEVAEEGEFHHSEWSGFFKSLSGPEMLVPTAVEDWIPKDAEYIYRYEGSLTTPAYSENVSWAVFSRPQAISRRQFELIFGNTKPHARELQPLNRRFVVAWPIEGFGE